MTNDDLLYEIVNTAILKYNPEDEFTKFTVYANEDTLKKINKALDDYAEFSDDLIMSTKGNDWYTFEWKYLEGLEDNKYEVKINVKDD